jgi:pimeloyl-ACP methyl ester carboxylesterase
LKGGLLDLPVGFYKFHKNEMINFSLNRWHSLGYTRKSDLERAADRIKSFEDYSNQFIQLAEEAEAENRLKNAAFYYRAAEFFRDPQDREKLVLYDKFHELFYRAFADENFQNHTIPYSTGHLPAIHLEGKNGADKGTLLAFGGFDSFIEEFYALWDFFSQAGYQVIAFEGPGQGAALRKYGLAFEHDWEKPTAAVLDYFNVPNAALLGISMGGYWALRAAAFEKRISRVIAFPPLYDWVELAGPLARKLLNFMMRRPRLMNFIMRLEMPRSREGFTVRQALYITKKQEPIDAARFLLGMNKDHIHSDRVDQDVLLLVGENDSFQPPKLAHKQAKALVNARSITTRIFTKEEQADQHCQMGNLPLALNVMLEWLIETHQQENLSDVDSRFASQRK